jgi:hypothetical protein
MRRLLSALVFAWVLACPLTAQDTPQLSELQKAKLEARILAVELAQARLDALLRELDQPGYNLTREGTYVKKAEPAKP